jgi:hypothetical protein
MDCAIIAPVNNFLKDITMRKLLNVLLFGSTKAPTLVPYTTTPACNQMRFNLNHSTLPPVLITGEHNVAQIIDALMYYQNELQMFAGHSTKLIALRSVGYMHASFVLELDIDGEKVQKIVDVNFTEYFKD